MRNTGFESLDTAAVTNGSVELGEVFVGTVDAVDYCCAYGGRSFTTDSDGFLSWISKTISKFWDVVFGITEIEVFGVNVDVTVGVYRTDRLP